MERTSYRYVLGDATGAGGAVQDAGIPSAAPTGANALTVSPVGDKLLLATTYTSKAGQNAFAVYVNDVAPPAPVASAPGPRQVTLQSTPGGKGFRIQVQYSVPADCKPTCTAHAEIRTRTGARRLSAVDATAPLPGNGKVVLGTRGSVKLSMLWIESVPSLRYHTAKTPVRASPKNTVEARYGTPSSTCTPSAAIVPKTATITTASQ